MSGNVYTLLVGIDSYPGPINQLHGCVNDVMRIDEFLRARLGDQYKPMFLANEQATRQAVIKGFQEHLTQATAEDVALFYYSGHGSQEPAPPEFWSIEPDRQNETLVCYDSRLPGQWDLADKELAQLIAQVAEKKPHFLLLLDCCHSGSGTRAPERTPGIRLTSADTRPRRAEDYLLSQETIDALRNIRPIDADGTTGWAFLRGRHVVFAACAADEEAKEQWFVDRQQGAFSYYLLDALQAAGEGTSYRDLHKRVNARVRNSVNKQAPQLESTDPADLGQPFLGGDVLVHQPYFTLTYDKAQTSWYIDGGAVHNIPPVRGTETTVLRLFPQDASAEILKNPEAALGTASVVKVGANRSEVALNVSAEAMESENAVYKAVIASTPLPPLIVALQGDENAIELVRAALRTAQPSAQGGSPSLFVREGPSEQATLRVIAEVDGVRKRYRIVRQSDIYSLAVDVEGFSAGTARTVVERLEHIERWSKLAELSNTALTFPADAVKVELFRVHPDESMTPISDTTNIRLEYDYVKDKWEKPRFKIKLTNTTHRKLYCALIDLNESYGIWPALITNAANCAELDPAHEAVWAYDGKPIPAYIPDALWKDGMVELKERIKIIVSDAAFDADLLEQSDLDTAVVRGGVTRSVKQDNTLSRFFRHVSVRGLGDEPTANTALSDWSTSDLILTIVRPQEVTPVRSDAPISLGADVRMRQHPTLQANARLTSVSEASRGLTNRMLPTLLRNNPDVSPFEFSVGRSGEPGLSVIELTSVQNHESVTLDAPLIVETRPLVTGEYLLAVAYDEQDEIYLPLGIASIHNKGEITLERLPNPADNESRNIQGTIKIFFQKVASKYLGTKYDYPMLRVAEIAEDGGVTYSEDGDEEAVRARVADPETKDILLYVHGIIADTRVMAASARTGWLKLGTTPPALVDRYDLILSFDYETMHTKIEENAAKLKERLAAIGLGSNHGKTLHIVAHSMGGLVSRWFIEQEGGGVDQMVQHLVMMGTPNAGSPWPTVQDWVTAMVGIAINGLSTVALPVKALGDLLSAVETIDNGLDQMRPGSDFLKTLASSKDPHIPYTMIAGNTSIIPEAFQVMPGRSASLFDKLWKKIQPKMWWYDTLDLAFFNQPNDIAVSVASAQSVPTERDPKPEVEDPVACDHVSYFNSAAGLGAIATYLPIPE